MGMLTDLRTKVWNWFLAGFDEALYERQEFVNKRRAYRTGIQPPQLMVRYGQYNDNLTVNFAGLVIDRSVSLLLGKGLKFDLPGEGETEQGKYIEEVYKANKQGILFQKGATLASESGTGYIKIVPDGLPWNGKLLPRLIALDPFFLTIDTLPEDIEQVIRYTIRYTIVGPDGKEKAKRELIEYDAGDVQEDGSILGGGTWSIETQEASGATGGKWETVSNEPWPYEFPPIVHWQNLPSATSVYGEPELTDDVLNIQDRLNFVASNISKIIRIYAHPMRYGKMLGDGTKIQAGPDEMPSYNDPDAEIIQLDQLGDLAGAAQFLAFLQKSLMDITQTIDFSNMGDKLGALTNFGLRVLTHDAMARLGIKRELFGDMLLELNRRLLTLAGMEADPGEIVWPEPLPQDETELISGYTFDLSNDLVSKQTISERRGYKWKDEQERMDAEKQTMYEDQEAWFDLTNQQEQQQAQSAEKGGSTPPNKPGVGNAVNDKPR